MNRRFSRFLQRFIGGQGHSSGHGLRESAVAALAVLALTACGGNAHSTPDASSPAKSQAAVPAYGGHENAGYNASPSRHGIRPMLLRGATQAQRSAEKNRRAGNLGIKPFVSGPSPVGVFHQISHFGIGAPPFASSTMSLSGNASRRTAMSADPTALVLYDTAGPWGYLGELYAMAVANLAGHFGQASAEPISAYVSGQINQFTATIYIGSSYYDQAKDGIPPAFYADVSASLHPVVWMGVNIWNFAQSIGATAFEKQYGWDPTTSFFSTSSGGVGEVAQVNYKGEALTRTVPPDDDGGVLRDNILGAPYPAVATLAQAVDTSTSPATIFPWAIRSSNLTYIGEIPFNFLSESDRVICFEDLLFDALAPATPTRRRAMVRLEDLNANENQTPLMQVAQFLYQNNIPYGFNVIPLYEDPLGTYNQGVAKSIALNSSAAASFVATIKYMQTHGGTIISEGYTHQYSNVANPYDGVSGDDAEFFLARVGANNDIDWEDPIPADSASWAQDRVNKAVAAFKSVNLTPPKYWVTPHYFATDVDYRAVATTYQARYESSVYYAGTLSKQPINYTEFIGEFFPYTVQDAYGTTVLPENLGDYEPAVLNNNSARTAADLIAEAKRNLAVRDGYASFFYSPAYGVGPLEQIINGIKALGYAFVPTGS